MSPKTIVCSECGTPFTAVYKLDRTLCEFCTARASKRRLVASSCQRCGEPFLVQHRLRNTRRFCKPCKEQLLRMHPHCQRDAQRDARMVAMYEDVRSVRRVAAAFGVSRPRAYQILSRNGVDMSYERYSVSRWDELHPDTQRKYAPRSHWPREGLASFKRKHGFCLSGACRARAAEGRTMCTKHLEENKQSVRPYAIAKYRQRRAAGLCSQCDNPPVPGRTLCEMHRDRNKAAQRRYMERRATA